MAFAAAGLRLAHMALYTAADAAPCKGSLCCSFCHEGPISWLAAHTQAIVCSQVVPQPGGITTTRLRLVARTGSRRFKGGRLSMGKAILGRWRVLEGVAGSSTWLATLNSIRRQEGYGGGGYDTNTKRQPPSAPWDCPGRELSDARVDHEDAVSCQWWQLGHLTGA